MPFWVCAFCFVSCGLLSQQWDGASFVGSALHAQTTVGWYLVSNGSLAVHCTHSMHRVAHYHTLALFFNHSGHAVDPRACISWQELILQLSHLLAEH